MGQTAVCEIDQGVARQVTVGARHTTTMPIAGTTFSVRSRFCTGCNPRVTLRVMSKRKAFLFGAIACLFTFAAAAESPDAFDAAVTHPGRFAADLARDPIDHPAEVLRLANIH